MNISENDRIWIADTAINNESFTEEQITEWLNEAVDTLKVAGLDATFGCIDGEPLNEAFMEMAKIATVGKIQANVAVKPTEFQLMMLGPYPERTINKKPFVEMIGVASLDGANPIFSTVSAWREFASLKNNVEPLGSYKTGVSFFEEDLKIDPKHFRLSVQKATIFSDETKTDFMGETYADRLAAFRDQVPLVKLGSVENNLSALKTGSGKSTSKFSDPLDLKKILVQVTGYNDGVDKNGRAWALYQVVDDTFKPTVKVKSMTVWVDPSTFERLQAGNNSLLEIYGMIQKDKGDGAITMSACFVNPILVYPPEAKDEAKTDQPGGVVPPPETPQITVVTHDGM